MQRDGMVLASGANHHALAGKRRLEWNQQWINGAELAETNTFDGTGQDVWEGDEAACALLRAD